MRDFLFIGCGSGLHDGLNPCVFMICAVLIVHGLWLHENSWRVFWLRLIFALTCLFGSVFFNFGPGQILVLQNIFVEPVKVVYFVLGLLSFILGVKYFKDWFLLSRSTTENAAGDQKVGQKKLNFIWLVLITVVLGVLFGGLAAFWPVNNFVLILANEAFSKGLWKTTIPLIVAYIVMDLWPLWIVWAFLSIKGIRPSFYKIVISAIFFTASSCMILMFT